MWKITNVCAYVLQEQTTLIKMKVNLRIYTIYYCKLHILCQMTLFLLKIRNDVGKLRTEYTLKKYIFTNACVFTQSIVNLQTRYKNVQ